MASSVPVKWPISKDDYELQEIIGVGATAVVQAANCKPRNERVAVKRIDLEKYGASIDEMQKEIGTMCQCNHDNVVNYYTSFIVKQELWIVMRLLDGGSMLDVLRYQMKLGRNQGVLDEVIIASVLKEVLKGLEYFHCNGLIHRDIKAGNILLGTDGTVQVADFGVSSVLYSYGDRTRPEKRTTFVGTPCWMAPEVMEQVTAYNNKADIWSFGITAIELATGTAPYAKFPAMKVLMLTLQNDPPTLESTVDVNTEAYKKYSKPFRRMISLCLQKEPAQRPCATELLKNPFFKKAKGKDFIKEFLLPLVPPLGERSQKVKRVPGSSGRLHKTPDGTWQWSDDEDEERPEKQTTTTTNSTETPTQTGQTAKSSVPQSTPSQPSQTIDQPATTSAADNSAKDGPKEKQVELNLTLRLRNVKNELNDIRFDFKHGEDTPQGVAQELVSAGLIDGTDMILVAANLEKVVLDPKCGKSVVFPLKTALPSGQTKDEKSLVGFAQLTLN